MDKKRRGPPVHFDRFEGGRREENDARPVRGFNETSGGGGGGPSLLSLLLVSTRFNGPLDRYLFISDILEGRERL